MVKIFIAKDLDNRKPLSVDESLGLYQGGLYIEKWPACGELRGSWTAGIKFYFRYCLLLRHNLHSSIGAIQKVTIKKLVFYKTHIHTFEVVKDVNFL